MKRVPGAMVVMMLAAAVPASAVGSFFDVFTEMSSAGPPYPTSPTQTKFFQGAWPDPVQAGVVNLGIHNVTGTPLAAHVRAWDPAGGAGVLSPSSFFDVFREASQPAPPPTSSSFFDIWVEPLTNGGQPGVIVGAGGGMGGGGGSGGASRSYFDVALQVVTDDGGPRPLRLYGEVPEGQSMYFGSGGRFQMVGGKLHIIPRLVFDGAVSDTMPLISITMTPEPSSMFLLLAGAAIVRRRAAR